MPCVIPISFSFNQTEHQCVRLHRPGLCAGWGRTEPLLRRCSRLPGGDSTSLASPSLTLPPPHPAQLSLANVPWQGMFRAPCPLGHGCLSSTGCRECWRSGRTRLPGSLCVPQMNPFLPLWRSPGTKSLRGIGQNCNDFHSGTLAGW